LYYKNAMNTFRGRVLFVGSIAILFGSILLFYSIYRVNFLDDLIEKDKKFYVPMSRDVAGLEGLFQSYQMNINKMISEPAKYSVYDIQNSPLKSQIEGKIEKISQATANFYSTVNDQESKKYADSSDTINKSFRNYNLSAMAIVEAFTTEGKESNQEFVNINKFFTIIKDSETSIITGINSLADSMDEKIVLGSVNAHHHFNRVMAFLFILWAIYIGAMLAMIIYSKKVSSYLFKISGAMAKIKSGQFDPEEISNSIPLVDEAELFELADKVTRLAKTVHEESTGYRDRISYLENDNARQKIIATYTTSMINSINVAVMVTDSLLKVSFVNAEFERLWKIKKTSVVDVEITDLPFIRMVDGWKDALSKVILGDGKKSLMTFNGEYKVSSKAKKELEFQIMPLREQNAKDILGTLTIVRESK
jgi:hypothetical protein